jgi:hypothetical protein
VLRTLEGKGRSSFLKKRSKRLLVLRWHQDPGHGRGDLWMPDVRWGCVERKRGVCSDVKKGLLFFRKEESCFIRRPRIFRW